MAEYIEIWSIIIGSVLGTIGTGLGIWNLIKSLVKKPKPTILEPVIQDFSHIPTSEMPFRIDFEIRNNGDRVTRLYLSSIMSLYLDEKLVEANVQKLDESGNVVYDKHMLPPHCILPSHYTHVFSENKKFNNGIIEFEGHYFNHRNKKVDYNQKFSFKDVGIEWKIEEIKEKKYL